MKTTLALCIAAVMVTTANVRADLTESLKAGAVDIKQAGPLAFGPDGVLFVGDTQQGAIYAIATGDTKGDAAKAKVDVKGVDAKIAALLGTTAADILINDMAVNPTSGNVYLSVSRGRGTGALPAIVKIDAAGVPSELKLSDARFSKATFENIAASGNQRTQSITDLAFVEGKVIVAGLSNEEFASKLRTLDFPFKSADRGASVEIFHGNHGQVETRSPVRSFATLTINGTTNVIAGYTCTPLVVFPIADLKAGQKVTGKTVAELGAGNNPLDIITYKKQDKEFLLVNNSRYGIMKVSTEEIPSMDPIKQRVPGTAGLKFETIAALTNVAQVDKLNNESAVLLVTAGGTSELRTVALP